MSTSGPKYGFVAALFTRMSSDPNLAIVSLTTRSASLLEPTCATTAATFSWSLKVARASLRFSSFLEEMTTLAPLSWSACAIARPIPLLAPVINATFPFRFVLIIERLGHSLR